MRHTAGSMHCPVVSPYRSDLMPRASLAMPPLQQSHTSRRRPATQRLVNPPRARGPPPKATGRKAAAGKSGHPEDRCGESQKGHRQARPLPGRTADAPDASSSPRSRHGSAQARVGGVRPGALGFGSRDQYRRARPNPSRKAGAHVAETMRIHGVEPSGAWWGSWSVPVWHSK